MSKFCRDCTHLVKVPVTADTSVCYDTCGLIPPTGLNPVTGERAMGAELCIVERLDLVNRETCGTAGKNFRKKRKEENK